MKRLLGLTGWMIMALTLVPLFVGCGEAPLETGIRSVRVANGDFLVLRTSGVDDGDDTSQYPEAKLPTLREEEEPCGSNRGLEIYPQRTVGPVIEEGWKTDVTAEKERFHLSFDASVSQSSDTLNVGWRSQRTGENAYVLTVENAEEQPLMLHVGVEIDGDAEAAEYGSARSEVAFSMRIFALLDGACQELTAELDPPEFAFAAGAAAVNEEFTLSIDAERITVILYASGRVSVSQHELFEDEEGELEHVVSSAWTKASFDLLVGNPSE